MFRATQPVILILLIMSLPAASQSSFPADKMDAVFNDFFNPTEPGGAVLVAHEGNVIYKKGFGIADVHSRDPITTKTLFNTGSISKTFVAYGILQLAHQQKLSLEDDLYTYFPDFQSEEIARKVKIHHLLTHSSGLPDSRKVKEQHEFYLTAKDEENFAPLKETKQLEFEPGTAYRYSNPAFNGLALIIEKVAGVKWQDYIREHVFRPANMHSSTITDGPHPTTGVAHGYVINEHKQFEELDYGEEPTFAAAGNGGVWSSVEELWAYEKAIQSNVLLPAYWIGLSRTVYSYPTWTAQEKSRLGLSWFITREMDSPMIGHTGSQGGFISDYVWLPEKKLFYVLLCNYPKPILDIRRRVLAVLQEFLNKK